MCSVRCQIAETRQGWLRSSWISCGWTSARGNLEAGAVFLHLHSLGLNATLGTSEGKYTWVQLIDVPAATNLGDRLKNEVLAEELAAVDDEAAAVRHLPDEGGEAGDLADDALQDAAGDEYGEPKDSRAAGDQTDGEVDLPAVERQSITTFPN